MSRGSEYLRINAWLLLWAILPLPFSRIVQPPFWLASVLVAALLLGRGRPLPPLPLWLQNLLGLVFLAAVIMAGGLNVGPLRPLGHLLLLLTATRLAMVRDRASGLRSLLLVGLVWAVAVASSTHVSLVLYLVASAVILWWVGMRVLLLGLETSSGAEGPSTPIRGPKLAHAALAGLLALTAGVPVFLMMPRLDSPWLAAGGGSRSVAGFSAAVELNSVGIIRQSREVALVVTSTTGDEVREEWTRLRGTAFDLARTGSWAARHQGLEPLPARDGLRWLGRSRSLRGTAALRIELLRPERFLFLPEGTVALRCPVELKMDPVGGVRLSRRRRRPLVYDAWVSEASAEPRRTSPDEQDLFLPETYPEVHALAEEIVLGVEGARARAEAVADHLQREYVYSDTPFSPLISDPVRWFLFEGREGHCEFFAGSMVVMLRTLGMPARMVGGYNGGTGLPNGDTVLVRQSNAHTWVEVWLGEDEGWVVIDPTPAGRVPGLAGLGGMARARWLWDVLQMTWDRYVLTFGLGEQVELFSNLVDGGLRWTRRLTPLRLVGAAAVLLALWLLARSLRGARTRLSGARGRRRGPAAKAVERLARRLSASGDTVPPGATARSIGRRASRLWPQVAGAVDLLVRLAEVELYSGGDTPAESASTVRRLWTEIRWAANGPRDSPIATQGPG